MSITRVDQLERCIIQCLSNALAFDGSVPLAFVRRSIDESLRPLMPLAIFNLREGSLVEVVYEEGWQAAIKLTPRGLGVAYLIQYLEEKERAPVPSRHAVTAIAGRG